MARRRYTEQDIAAALAALDANAGNVLRTAEQLGIPHSTLQSWIQQQAHKTPIAELRKEKKQALADVFEDVARRYLSRALDETAVRDTDGKSAVIAAATATDKMRLLRGLPTEIVAILPDVVSALQAAGLDPVMTFQRMIQHAHEHAKQRADR